MILGLNSDVRYKGKTYHIQTEDSGRTNPVLMTHVFIGGTILNTLRASYADALEREDLDEHVRGLMREQHRGAYQALLSGALDDAIKRGSRQSSLAHIPLARDTADSQSTPAPTPPAASTAASDPAPNQADEHAATPAPLEHGPDESLESVIVEAQVEPRDEIRYDTDLVGPRAIDPIVLAYLLEDLEP